jgi:putative acetyltransferase
MHTRKETGTDRDAVYAINAAAFESPFEARLVNRLRERAQPLISLVAVRDGKPVGHIMFSPVTLSGHPDVLVMGLGPMAVMPPLQRTGVGSALVSAGLEDCKDLACAAVVVLGHPGYYPRFGFRPALNFGIDSEYEVPGDVFMALELHPGSLDGKAGRVKYHAAFSDEGEN